MSGTSISTRLPCVSINQRRLRSTPARDRLSSKRTLCPEERRRCARFEPTNPAPPVIKTGLDFPFLWTVVGGSVFLLLPRPLPSAVGLVFPLVMLFTPCSFRRSHMIDRDEFRGVGKYIWMIEISVRQRTCIR